MLKSLDIKNFAIIEDLHVDFSSGMTVLTGETGAGKSLIIDTISLLLGQRADGDMIRYEEKKASILGVFTYQNSKIDELLNKYSIPILPELSIYREIIDNSRNTIKINNTQVSLTILKQLANILADIHVQNDTFKLFNQENYLEFITPNADSSYDKLFAEYTVSYANYLEAYKNYNRILTGQKEEEKRLEFLEYEKEELSKLELTKDIDLELKASIAKLENYDKIFSSLSSAYENLENDMFSLDNIYTSANALKKITDLDEGYQESYEKLLDSYYILDEIKNNLYKQLNNLDFNQEELNIQNEKLNEIEKVKAKYKMSVNELIDYLNEISLRIEMVKDYDNVLKEAEEHLIKKFEIVKVKALALSNYRKKLAKNIEIGIKKECLDLDLADTEFKIEFKEINLDNFKSANMFNETGIDEVEFMISFNKGEPLRSLHKVASGGEMSRIMLAFKSYFASNANLSLMVFDEIDTGVSGSTAKKIADKLSNLAKYTQTLCITHLPQVASVGDQHIHIYKEVINNRTTTHIKYLDYNQRVEEIAMMLSGDKLSLYALEHAKALLKQN